MTIILEPLEKQITIWDSTYKTFVRGNAFGRERGKAGLSKKSFRLELCFKKLLAKWIGIP